MEEISPSPYVLRANTWSLSSASKSWKDKNVSGESALIYTFGHKNVLGENALI